MAKIKKSKLKGANAPPGQSSGEPIAAVITAASAALHPSSHTAAILNAHEGNSHGGAWPTQRQASIEEDEDEGEGDWGTGGAAASAAVWDPPSDNTWGAAPGAWGNTEADDGWGQPTVSHANVQGVQGPQGSARPTNAQPAPPESARAPTHNIPPTNANTHQMSPSGWGAPPGMWATEPPQPSWAQPPAPSPPGQKPAWANWATEAKLIPPSSAHPPPALYTSQPPAVTHGGTRQALSEQQRSQILSSLLEVPQQQGHFQQSQHQPNSKQRPPGGQSQAYLQAQLLAQQQSILHSIQDSHGPPNGQAHRGQVQPNNAPVQYADSWGNWRGETWNGDRASTIPEEDEYGEDDDGWGDTGDEAEAWGTGQGYGQNQRVRFSSNVSYAGTPSVASRTPSHGPTPAPGASPPRGRAVSNPQMWMPSTISSRTMKIATGTLSPTPLAAKTTVFELTPPRNGFGENAFVSSHGEALKLVESAFYNRDRPAKERIRWGFNPDKDPRVGSLLRWVAAMSNGLADIGLQRFLDTRERGALFANANYHVSVSPGAPPQPAFDWVTLSELQSTLDSTLQSSVTLYDPAFQVIVFVLLPSPSGNSMAVWRRKLNVPDAIRDANQDEILAVKAGLQTTYPVYVDEARLPVPPQRETPPVKKKKKVRFAFIRRIFGGVKKSTPS